LRKLQEIFLGSYEAKALEASIHTEADNKSELKKTIRDGVKCHFNENERPRIIRLHFAKEEVIKL